MRKRVFHLPAIISLILMAAVIVFWQRSYRVRDSILYRCGSNAVGKVELGSADGDMAFIWQRSNPSISFEWTQDLRLKELPDWPRGFHVRSEPVPIDVITEAWGTLWTGVTTPRMTVFHKSWGDLHLGGDVLFVRLRAWIVLLLLSPLPLMRLIQLLRARRRAASGLCEHCGYDLRHTPDRCPECGQPVHIPEDPAAKAPSA